MTSGRASRTQVAVALGLVYLFWGSTYLGIRLAITYIPPELMTGIRFSVAGAFMLAYCGLTGRGIRMNAGQFWRMAVIGILLLSISNVILAWAEETVPSGLASLIVAITPLWFLILETWMFHADRISRRGLVGLGLGIVGIAVLLWPKLMATSALAHRQFTACMVLLFGSLCWSLGSAFSKRWQKGIDAFSASAWQMLIAGIVNIAVGFATGAQHRAVWNWKGLGAVAYLVVFGSWVGFSAYIWVLQHLPMSKVATYAYVNPVVAVFLGWLVLHERVDAYILAGAAIVVASVALVTQAEMKTKPKVDAAPDATKTLARNAAD